MTEERDFKREELLRKYIEKMLYSWDDRKFEDEYLRKLERNWEKQKGKDKTIWGEKTSFSSREILNER